MTTTISNTDDVIDSRDVIARIEELTDIKNDTRVCHVCEAGKNAPPCSHCGGTGEEPNGAMDDDEAAELKALESLADEASGYAADWKHGETLIRDSYFTEYAMEMLSDIGDLPRNVPWYIEIDEDATASNVRMDYTSVDFDGETYWVR